MLFGMLFLDVVLGWYYNPYRDENQVTEILIGPKQVFFFSGKSHDKIFNSKTMSSQGIFIHLTYFNNLYNNIMIRVK